MVFLSLGGDRRSLNVVVGVRSDVKIFFKEYKGRESCLKMYRFFALFWFFYLKLNIFPFKSS